MSEKKRKSKSFYKKMAKMSRNSSNEIIQLSNGLRGFLITCNFNEYNCLKDSYAILNDISERLYGTEMKLACNEDKTGNNQDDGKEIDSKNHQIRDEQKDDQDESIEKSIEAELASLKSTKERRFHQVRTKCQNVIFVKTNDLKVIPNDVVEQLFGDIQSSGVMNSRYIQRFLPVNITFKANKEVFFDRFSEYFDEFASKESKKFSVLTKVRFNSDHPSESSLKEACIKIIKNKRSNWTVRHDSPEIMIAINICMKAACLSLLENYENFSKYNPGEYLKKLTRSTTKEVDKTESNDSKKNDVKLDEIIENKTEIQNSSTDSV